MCDIFECGLRANTVHTDALTSVDHSELARHRKHSALSKRHVQINSQSPCKRPTFDDVSIYNLRSLVWSELVMRM